MFSVYSFNLEMYNLSSLTNPSPDDERDIGKFVDEEEGDIDNESDVELDGNDQLDLNSEPNDDDLESDLISD